METIRYTGEDIPIDLTLQNDDGTAIDPTTLDAIYVHLVDSSGETIEKYAEPAKVDYEPLEVDETKVRLWLQSALTAQLADKKLHIQLNIEEANATLDDGRQNTIALSDTLLIKHAAVGAESGEVV